MSPPAPACSEVMNLIGDVRGKVAVLVDDMIDTAGGPPLWATPRCGRASMLLVRYPHAAMRARSCWLSE